jgi:pyruvate/2-oxoglutarate/acetoin dehydrogenase E1 component
LEDPDPVIIFEHATLYNMTESIAADAGAVDIDKAAIRREGTDISLITYGGSLPKVMAAAAELEDKGVSCEVLDLRTLRPLDEDAIIATVSKTRRALVVDEGWRSGSLSAEISARIMEKAFYELDAPVERLCSVEVPIPYAAHLEKAALPQAAGVVDAVLAMMGKS